MQHKHNKRLVHNNMLTHQSTKSKVNTELPEKAETVLSKTRSDLTRPSEVRLNPYVVYPEGVRFKKELLAVPTKGAIERNIDWLTFTGRRISRDNFDRLIQDFVSGQFWDIESKIESTVYDANFALYRGCEKYDTWWVNSLGIKVASRKNEELDQNGKTNYESYDVIVSLSGSVLQQLYGFNNLLGLSKLVYCAYKLGLHISRIDLAITDYSKTLNVFDVKLALLKGNYKGFKVKSTTESGVQTIDGVTNYCGSRESESFVRIYDCWKKHGILATRLENELKGDKAKKVGNDLVKFYVNYSEQIEKATKNSLHGCNKTKSRIRKVKGNFNRSIARYSDSVITSQIDFIDRGKTWKNGSLKHCKRLSWWEKFREKLSASLVKIKLTNPVKKPILADTIKWFFKQVKGAISKLKNGLCDYNFNQLMELLKQLDDDRPKPKGIQEEKELTIKILKKQGIRALFTQDELQEFKERFGIEFDVNNYHGTIFEYDNYFGDKYSDKLAIGDKVRFILGGIWFNGTIKKINKTGLEDETYDVNFDDGGFYSGIIPDNIFRLKSS